MTISATLPCTFVTGRQSGRGEGNQNRSDRRKIHAADYGRETRSGERQQPCQLQPFVRHRVLKIRIQFAVKVTGFTGQCGDGAGMQQLKRV